MSTWMACGGLGALAIATVNRLLAVTGALAGTASLANRALKAGVSEADDVAALDALLGAAAGDGDWPDGPPGVAALEGSCFGWLLLRWNDIMMASDVNASACCRRVASCSNDRDACRGGSAPPPVVQRSSAT